MVVWFQIVEGFESGALKGAATLEELQSYTGVAGPWVAKTCLGPLRFQKAFKPDGTAYYSPPRKGRKLDWPTRYACLYHLVKNGVQLAHASNLMSRYGDSVGLRVVAQFPLSDGLSVAGLFASTAHEMHSSAALASDAVITTVELAEILRESPNMPKEGLLNRARGLVKAATRKGNWDEWIRTPIKKEKDNG